MGQGTFGKNHVIEIERLIPGSPNHVFDAWVKPEELHKWWGPKGVLCRSADIDLRVGGNYKIENQLPDGSVLWITGQYERIDRPRLLIFSWRTNVSGPDERVTIKFKEHLGGTMINLVHERIPTRQLSDQHRHGWTGCLDGLSAYIRPELNIEA